MITRNSTTTLLGSIPTTYAALLLTGTAEIQVQLLLEVLVFQLSKASDRSNKQRAFHFWLGSLEEKDGEVASRLLGALFLDGEPDWLVELNATETSASAVLT